MTPRIVDPYKWTLDTWVKGFAKIYEKNDDKSSYSQIWQHVVRHMSRVSEDIRQRWYRESIIDLSNAFVWVLCFVDRLIDDMKKTEMGKDTLKKIGQSFNSKSGEEIGQNYIAWILYKYPLICSYCGFSPCRCPSHRHIIELRHTETQDEFKKFRKRTRELIKENRKKLDIELFLNTPLNKFIEYFIDIYRGPVFGRSEDEICHHLLEEVGEVAAEIWGIEAAIGIYNSKGFKDWVDGPRKDWDVEEIKKVKNTAVNKFLKEKENEGVKNFSSYIYKQFLFNLITELSDVFSWVVSLLIIVNSRLSSDYSLVDAWLDKIEGLPDEYKRTFYNQKSGTLICPYCGQTRCSITCIRTTLLIKNFVKNSANAVK